MAKWQEDLEAALARSEWVETPPFGVRVRVATITVPPFDFKHLHSIIRCVNDRPMAGVATGCLLLLSAEGQSLASSWHLTFAERDRPWNLVPFRGNEWREVCDAHGRQPYPACDFSILP